MAIESPTPAHEASASEGAAPPKARAADLAALGGAPAFEEFVYVGRPEVPDRAKLLARIEEALDRRWFTNAGPLVRELERRLADRMGVKHCICTCNGTVALEIAIRATGLAGEVIVPSFTFVATAHALQWQAITPIFCDVDPRTHNLDPARVEGLLTPRTSGIIGVHLWGRPCEVDALREIADRRGLRLLFDAAHAFGSTYGGRDVAGLGDAVVFSFHATKFFHTFEGGAIATNDDDVARRVRLMKNFGFVDYDRVDYIGTNGKMNEISAAMGLTALESLEEHVELNRERHELYARELDGIPGLRLVAYDPAERSNYQYCVVEVDPALAGLTRDQLVTVLHRENVLARRYFHPGCHRMEPYRSYFPNAGLLLPVTEDLTERVLCLPTGTAVDPDGVRTICRILRTAVEHADQLSGRVVARLTPPRYGETGLHEG